MLLTRRHMLALTAASVTAPALPVAAAPVAYRLDAGRSDVGFGVDLSGSTITGAMPVRAADMQLDFTQVGNSRVAVTLDAAGTRMGVFFATEAVRGPVLLHTAQHPTINFRSTRVQMGVTPSEAVIDGDLTIRGTTAPVRLGAKLTQDRATLGQDNPELTFRLTGRVDRNKYGITAYKGLVGPMVTLDIRASIKRV